MRGRSYIEHVALLVATGLVLAMGRRAAAQQMWTLEAEPCPSGLTSGSAAAGPIGPIAVGSDGRLFIGYPLRGIVRVFASTGDLVETIGGTADDRANFKDIAGIGLLDESVQVVDRRLRRVADLRPDGEFVGWVSVAEPAWDGRWLDLLPDGSWLVAPRRRVGGSDTVREPILRIRSGERVDTVAWATSGRGRARIRIGNQERLVPLPFDDGDLVAASARANRFVVVERSSATTAGEAHFQVTGIRADGDSIFSRRYAYTPRPVPEAVVDSIAASEAGHLARSGGGHERRSVANAVREAWSVGVWLPPVSAAVVSADGSVWLQRERLGNDRVNWMVLAPDGGVRATLTAPAQARVRWVDGDRVWIQHITATGCPLQPFRVRPAG